jgi:hypothetical protein
LASLFVEHALSSEVSSINGAIKAGLSICIHDGSASETIVMSLFPQLRTYAKLVNCSTIDEMYLKLDNEGCDLLVGTRQEFEIYKVQKRFGCGLLQVGDDLHISSANFAIKFDPLNCDSVLAYVMKIHLHAMSVDGNITELWDSYIDAIEGTCASVDDDRERRRRLVDTTDTSDDVSRSLAGRGGGRDTSLAHAISGGELDALHIKGMSGVFFFHGGGTVFALLLAIYAQFRKRNSKKKPFTNQVKLAEKEEIKSELQRRYEDLKHELDDLFQVQMAKQKSNVVELPQFKGGKAKQRIQHLVLRDAVLHCCRSSQPYLCRSSPLYLSYMRGKVSNSHGSCSFLVVGQGKLSWCFLSHRFQSTIVPACFTLLNPTSGQSRIAFLQH